MWDCNILKDSIREKRLKIILLEFCLLLFACAPKLNISEYTHRELDSRTVQHALPDYVAKQKKPRVAVLSFSAAPDIAKKCNLDITAKENVLKTLVKTRTAEVVEAVLPDSNAGGNVDFAQLSQHGSAVDFVITGSITSVNVYAQTFIEEPCSLESDSTLSDILFCLIINIIFPPSCIEEGKVSLTVKVLSFPEGTVLKVMNPTSTEFKITRKEEDVCSIKDVCGLLSGAVASASEKLRDDFMELFPTYGHVYKTMTHSKDARKRIAFITLGSGDGLKAGKKLDIVEFRKEGEDIVEFKIAECTVVKEKLKRDRSICVIPKNKADSVFVGHMVKTRAKAGLLRRIKKLAD